MYVPPSSTSTAERGRTSIPSPQRWIIVKVSDAPRRTRNSLTPMCSPAAARCTVQPVTTCSAAPSSTTTTLWRFCESAVSSMSRQACTGSSISAPGSARRQ